MIYLEAEFSEAIALAASKHSGQRRKDGKTPYIYHPLAVARLLKDAGFDLKYQIVAVLHDVLEDTDTEEDELRVFGEDVLEAVKLLTRPEGADEEEYVAKILENPLASAVKNADKICNLRDAMYLGTPGEERTNKARSFAETYIRKAEKYYQGKFSLALDYTIEKAKEALMEEYVKVPNTSGFAYNELKIYNKDI